MADELDRQARGGIDPGYRRYADQTATGGRYEQGFPGPRVAAPATTAPTTTTTIEPPLEPTTTTTLRRGVFG